MTNNLDWDWLKSQCLSFHASRLNDVEMIKLSHKIRQEAYSKGFTTELVSKAMHRTGIIHRGGKEKPKIDDKKNEPAQEPQAKPEVDLSTTKPPARRKVVQNSDSGVSPIPKRWEGKSILDMADEKRKGESK